MTEIFTGDSYHERAFVGGHMTANKSNIADGGHIEFRKMLISLYSVLAQN